MKKRVATYMRDSKEEREKKFEKYSIERQTERLKTYAENQQWTEVKIFTDTEYSGSDMERPALQELIDQIKDDQVDILLVDRMDRLDDPNHEMDSLLKLLSDHHCTLVCREEDTDTSDLVWKIIRKSGGMLS